MLKEDGAIAHQPNWDLVQIDYRYGRLTIAAICRKHGITQGDLLFRAARHRWETLRTDDTDRQILIGLMLGVLERQITHLESVEMTATGDKEVVVLSKLASTLAKLIDIEDRARVPSGQGEDLQALRTKLARRIENLKRA